MFNESNRIEYCGEAIDRLKEHVYSKLCDLEMTAYVTKEPLPWERRTEGEQKEIKPGDTWGGLFDCAWFHVKGILPTDAAGKKTVLVIDLNGEGLVYDREGQPFRGITNINSDFDRRMGVPGTRIVPFG